jgi:hypothetical protein
MAIYMSRMEKATTMFLEGWARLRSSTYKSLGLRNNNDSRFAFEINKKGRAELTLPFSPLIKREFIF